MGAVYVTVRLSNVRDVEDAKRGLLASNEIRTCVTEALVDTGATHSIVPPDIAKKLGLLIHRQATGVLADGNRVTCGVALAVHFEIDGRDTAQDAYVMGDSVAIGQTVLESTDLLVDCVHNKVVPGHPAGPEFRL